MASSVWPICVMPCWRSRVSRLCTHAIRMRPVCIAIPSAAARLARVFYREASQDTPPRWSTPLHTEPRDHCPCCPQKRQRPEDRRSLSLRAFFPALVSCERQRGHHESLYRTYRTEPAITRHVLYLLVGKGMTPALSGVPDARNGKENTSPTATIDLFWRFNGTMTSYRSLRAAGPSSQLPDLPGDMYSVQIYFPLEKVKRILDAWYSV